MSQSNSRDGLDLWLPTSLQPSLPGQGSGAKAINHTQMIHVGGTQLQCSKNEKKTYSKTLKATLSITGWRLHRAKERKTHKESVSSTVINNTEIFLMAIRGSAEWQNSSWWDYSAENPLRTCIILCKCTGVTQQGNMFPFRDCLPFLLVNQEQERWIYCNGNKLLSDSLQASG